MERDVEGLVTVLQSVVAGWMQAREQRRAEKRRRMLKPVSFPMAATAVDDGATVCC